jgi:hypothetical protein
MSRGGTGILASGSSRIGERDAVRASYNDAKHLPERRRMLQAWRMRRGYRSGNMRIRVIGATRRASRGVPYKTRCDAKVLFCGRPLTCYQ